MIRRHPSLSIAALGVVLLWPSAALAQQPAAPQRGGAAPAGRGGPPPFNFASDDKPQKKAAREMMLMVRDINPKVAAAVGKSAEAATRVGCGPVTAGRDPETAR